MARINKSYALAFAVIFINYPLSTIASPDNVIDSRSAIHITGVKSGLLLLRAYEAKQIDIIYSRFINTNKFTAMLNGNNVTKYFTPKPGGSEKVMLPLIVGDNIMTFHVSEYGVDNKILHSTKYSLKIRLVGGNSEVQYFIRRKPVSLK